MVRKGRGGKKPTSSGGANETSLGEDGQVHASSPFQPQAQVSNTAGTATPPQPPTVGGVALPSSSPRPHSTSTNADGAPVAARGTAQTSQHLSTPPLAPRHAFLQSATPTGEGHLRQHSSDHASNSSPAHRGKTRASPPGVLPEAAVRRRHTTTGTPSSTSPQHRGSPTTSTSATVEEMMSSFARYAGFLGFGVSTPSRHDSARHHPPQSGESSEHWSAEDARHGHHRLHQQELRRRSLFVETAEVAASMVSPDPSLSSTSEVDLVREDFYSASDGRSSRSPTAMRSSLSQSSRLHGVARSPASVQANMPPPDWPSMNAQRAAKRRMPKTTPRSSQLPPVVVEQRAQHGTLSSLSGSVPVARVTSSREWCGHREGSTHESSSRHSLPTDRFDDPLEADDTEDWETADHENAATTPFRPPQQNQQPQLFRTAVGRSSATVNAARDGQSNDEYRRNWSQVVLGATSGIMFVLVAAICYAVYLLVQPYSRAITTSVLLSVVLHPRSQLRSSLYMRTCVKRMQRMHRRWAQRGRLSGLLGTWLSLRHFASFVSMQGVFFLGLNKIRVNVYAAEPASPRRPAATPAGPPSSSAPDWDTQAAPDDSTQTSLSGRKTKGKKRRKKSREDKGLTLTSSGGAPPSSPTPRVRYTRHAVLLVTDASGRRVLRYLSVFIFTTMAHMLLGLRAFALLHVALFSLFAITSPLLSTGTFVTGMGRLWRVAIVFFFVIGVAYNLAVDVLSVSQTVRRTTSVVVGHNERPEHEGASPVLSLSALHEVRQAVKDGNVTALQHWCDAEGSEAVHAIRGSTSHVCCAVTTVEGGAAVIRDDCLPALDALATAQEEKVTTTVGAGVGHRTSGGLASAVPGLLSQHRDEIQTFVLGKLQERLLQELTELFNHTNVTETAREVLLVLQQSSSEGRAARPPQNIDSSASEANAATITDVADSATASPAAQKPAAWQLLSSLSRLFPLSVTGWGRAVADLTHTSTPQESASDVESGGGKQVGRLAALWSSSRVLFASSTSQVDWLGVSRVVSARLLPYLEYSVRLLVRLGANLMDLFDSIYALILFVLIFRYLTQLEHTVLYYVVAKMLKVVQPEQGESHARNIEQDITASFLTLLQSFWHLTWFHFSITFCTFKLGGLPTPSFFACISVALALFPLVPKWLSPCSLALMFSFHRIIGEVGLLRAVCSPRVLVVFIAVVLDYSDEWLLCVSRQLRGDSVIDSAGHTREQLPPFVVGTSVVLGFVSYGMRGIVLGPLTVIVAKVLFDNWDIVLTSKSNQDEYDEFGGGVYYETQQQQQGQQQQQMVPVDAVDGGEDDTESSAVNVM